jgi:hypothetical protein
LRPSSRCRWFDTAHLPVRRALRRRRADHRQPRCQGDFKALVVNSVTALSLDPPLHCVCLDRESNTSQSIVESGVFSIDFPSDRQVDVGKHFASKNSDKLAAIDVVCGPAGDCQTFAGAADQVRNGEGKPRLLYRGACGAWFEGDEE